MSELNHHIGLAAGPDGTCKNNLKKLSFNSKEGATCTSNCLLQLQVQACSPVSMHSVAACQRKVVGFPAHLHAAWLVIRRVPHHKTPTGRDISLRGDKHCHGHQRNDEIDMIHCQMTSINARWWPLLAIALSLVHVNGQQLSTSQQQDFASITSGVGTIVTSAFTASRQCLYGTQAFAVAIDGDKLPFISAARYGSGRVIQFGHEGMLTTSTSSELFKLIRNSAIWASGKASGVRIAGMTSWGSNIASSISSVRI
jgi:hypothetical protein